MGWDACIKEHIRNISVDEDKINSILKMCIIRLKFIKRQIIDDESSSFIIEDYYEIIKELLTALLLKNGLTKILSFILIKPVNSLSEARNQILV